MFFFKGKRGNRRAREMGIRKTDSQWVSKFKGLEDMIMGTSKTAGLNDRQSNRRGKYDNKKLICYVF